MVFQAVLIAVLWAKKVWRTFPLFVFYSTCNFVGAIVIYAARTRAALFFYTFWIAEAIGIVLGLAVVYEIFKHIFAVHAALKRLATLIFYWTVSALLIVGILVLVNHSPHGYSDISSAVLVIEEAIRIIEVGLLMFLFVFSTAFGLHWKTPVFGIAVGLGIFSAVELIAVTMRSQMSAGALDMLSMVRILAFTASLLIWLGYLLAPERVTSESELPKRAQLEQWNQAITELIHQ